MLKIKSYDEDGVHDGWILLNPAKILAISYEFTTSLWHIVLGGGDGITGDAISLSTTREDVERILSALGDDLGPLAELEHPPETAEDPTA